MEGGKVEVEEDRILMKVKGEAEKDGNWNMKQRVPVRRYVQ